MFYWRKPSSDQVQTQLAQQAALPFSYSAVGQTNQTPPPGYVVDHNRVQIGTGRAIFEQAKQALRQWRMFDLGWVQICSPYAPLMPGTTVGVLATVCGWWSLNACRIVYVVDEPDRYGFAYGTLPDHLERGEERFLVEWRPADDAVWYDILAFSRPQHLLAKIGYPVVRQLQKRFAHDSKQAMVRHCHRFSMPLS